MTSWFSCVEILFSYVLVMLNRFLNVIGRPSDTDVVNVLVSSPCRRFSDELDWLFYSLNTLHPYCRSNQCENVVTRKLRDWWNSGVLSLSSSDVVPRPVLGTLPLHLAITSWYKLRNLLPQNNCMVAVCDTDTDVGVSSYSLRKFHFSKDNDLADWPYRSQLTTDNWRGK